MARTFIDISDQAEYVPLGSQLSAYGILKSFKDLQPSDLQHVSAEWLNKHASIIHFSRYHVNENDEPAGAARVLQVLWTEPSPDSRGQYPSVRLRDLKFGQRGSNSTARKRYTALELWEMLDK